MAAEVWALFGRVALSALFRGVTARLDWAVLSPARSGWVLGRYNGFWDNY